jgi:hypothetical protein
MSEYQYYEFQAIDRPLTEKEQTKIERLSSRVILSATQAIFTYNYGDLPGDPEKLVEKYFDAMLYVTNWGSKQLIFRIPVSVIDIETIKLYCIKDMVSVSEKGEYVLIDLCFDEEAGDWVEGEGWLSSLINLRNDIINNDYRMLYLAWLKAISLGFDSESESDELEPPVPANLKKLSTRLKRFINFFEIDKNLILAGSKASVTKNTDEEIDMEKMVSLLTEKECRDFLVRIARGEKHIDIKLSRRLQGLSGQDEGDVNSDKRRSVGELFELVRSVSN